MSTIAFLPMYVLRGAREHADMLWSCFRDSLRRSGFAAPEQVSSVTPRGLLDAVRAGVAALPDSTRNAFGLRGVVPLRRMDYEVIKTNLIQAEAQHSLPELEETPSRPL